MKAAEGPKQEEKRVGGLYLGQFWSFFTAFFDSPRTADAGNNTDRAGEREETAECLQKAASNGGGGGGDGRAGSRSGRIGAAAEKNSFQKMPTWRKECRIWEWRIVSAIWKIKNSQKVLLTTGSLKWSSD